MWSWMAITEAKPKFEILEAEKYMTKTRTIYVPHAFACIPAQMLWRNSYNKFLKKGGSIKNNMFTHKTSWSMGGFTPFHGELQVFLKLMWERANTSGVTFAVYADNLYVCFIRGDHLVMMSLDGSSMESSITHTDVVIENVRNIVQYGIVTGKHTYKLSA